MTDKHDQQIQTALRLPESLLKRVDKLAERMSRPGLPVMRAEILRLAVLEGVEALEAEKVQKR